MRNQVTFDWAYFPWTYTKLKKLTYNRTYTIYNATDLYNTYAMLAKTNEPLGLIQPLIMNMNFFKGYANLN